MEKLIDADEYQKEMFRVFSCNDSDDRNIRRAVELGIASASPVEAIPKEQYEARLKADMVAMLEEILLEAEENTVRWYVGRVDGKSDDVVLMETLQEIIQQKINKLRGYKKCLSIYG